MWCGRQIFHCTKEAASGGDTLLVDGFAVADRLRAEHPDTFQYDHVSPVAAEVVPAVLTLCLACRFFCDHPIEWQSVTPTATYSATHPVFATNASGQVTQLRCVAPPALASPYG